MARPDFPRTIVEFQRRFPDDAACRDYLFACRWPDGFRCPVCGFQHAYAISDRFLWQCSRCRHQVSITAGTVLHKTRTPLHLWFWAAYLTSTGTPGISALQLRRQLGLKRYETAWFLLHKLRRAMVAPKRSPLAGLIEVDDAYIGGTDSGRRGGRDALGAATIVLTAVEVRGNSSGRFRMEAVDDLSADALCGFVQDNVLEGATVRTDAWQGFKRLARLGYDHQPTSLRAEGRVGKDAALALPHVHRVIGNFKTWLRGTYRGVSDHQMQVYLDEFVFRFNRRRTPMAAFQTLLGIGSQLPPTTYVEVKDPGW
ncbi:MAG TPA: IS1595 family transposase [Candidatus Dormibacteraeota bacterium]|nr:IS1595 family transposase [Candidatus Dormibacteraeota bacterium]